MNIKTSILISCEEIGAKGLLCLLVNENIKVVPTEGIINKMGCISLKFFFESVINNSFPEDLTEEIKLAWGVEVEESYKNTEIKVNNINCCLFDSFIFKPETLEVNYKLSPQARLLIELLKIESSNRNRY